MRTTIRMNDDLLRRAKKLAAEEGRTLTAIIEEGVATVLNSRRAAVLNSRRMDEKKERFKLPVSSKTGGVWPGIDLNNSAQLYEIMDGDGPPGC